MSALAVTPAYSALLVRLPPRIVQTEEQNQSYVDALYELEQRHEQWTPEESDLAALLTLLVEDFESRTYALPKSSPAEMLEFLRDQHGLDHKELAGILGSAETASEVLDGKRELDTEQIRRLSQHFHVSPELFF